MKLLARLGLVCPHDWKFEEGQRVYLTKDRYDLVCRKCEKRKDFCPMVFGDFEKKLVEFGQEIREGCIADYVEEIRQIRFGRRKRNAMV